MQIKVFFVAISVCCVQYALGDEKVQEIKPDQMKIEIVNNNKHEIKVNAQSGDPLDPATYIGEPEKFKRCMQALPKSKLIDAIRNFDPRLRTAYLKSLTPCEAKDLYDELHNKDDQAALGSPFNKEFMKTLYKNSCTYRKRSSFMDGVREYFLLRGITRS